MSDHKTSPAQRSPKDTPPVKGSSTRNLKDLMSECFFAGHTAGRLDSNFSTTVDWDQWWDSKGRAMWMGYLPVSGMERMINDTHEVAVANNVMLQVMIDAMEDIDPPMDPEVVP